MHPSKWPLPANLAAMASAAFAVSDCGRSRTSGHRVGQVSAETFTVGVGCHRRGIQP